jgi:asparagine synthase (glutamine-hydrolysing)
MCGFVGHVGDFNYKEDLIKHRGPDAQYHYEENNFTLNFFRLAINGTENDSRQPFLSTSKRYSVWCNGEIFNYKALSEKYSINEVNSCDISVLPNLFEKIGISKALSELRGFFSLIIFDSFSRKIYLAIDHFGIKPLYYKIDKNGLIFSSELRVFDKSAISDSGLKNFFEVGSALYPNSLVQNVHTVSPGEIIQIEVDHPERIKKEIYWDIKTSLIGSQYIDLDTINGNLDLALERNSLSDYPIINLLSGGIDSTYLATHGKGIDNNIFFDFGKIKDNYERNNISLLKDKIKIETVNIEYNFLAEFDEYILSSDEPVFDFAGFVYNVLMKTVKLKGSRVVWNGTGGDELLFGYNRYSNLPSWKNYLGFLKNKQPLNNSYDFLKKGFCNKFDDQTFILNNINESKFPNQKEYLRFVDFKYYLPNNLLRYTDRISSFYNIESRVPFLDVDLVESVFYSNTIDKTVGKKSLLVDRILKKHPKLNFEFKEGLGLPIDKIITQDELYKVIVPFIINSKLLLSHPILNKFLNKDLKKRINIWNIMGLYSICKWHEI